MAGRKIDRLEVDEIKGGRGSNERAVALAERVDKADRLDQVFLHVFNVNAELGVAADGAVDEEASRAGHRR